MKKIPVILITLLCSFAVLQCSSGKIQNKFEQYSSLFVAIDGAIPSLRNVLRTGGDRGMPIPTDVAIRYIYMGDLSRVYSIDTSYSNDGDNEPTINKSEIDNHAVFKKTSSDYDLMAYASSRLNRRSIVLQTYTHRGELIDTLWVGENWDEMECILYKTAVSNAQLDTITVFTYSWNEKFFQNEKLPPSIVTVEQFCLDSKGHFNRSDKAEIFSANGVSDYAYLSKKAIIPEDTLINMIVKHPNSSSK